MGDNSDKQCSLDKGPACEGEKLIIEVLGKDHPQGHHLCLFDTADTERRQQLEDEVSNETRGDSVLHVWDWADEPDCNVWLEIDAEEDEPIQVPLFEAISASPRRGRREDNVVCPVMPLSLIPVDEPIDEAPDINAHAAPVRPGYLYVFFNGQLWRELHIRVDEAGATTFHDVRLSDYRQEDAPLSEDKRDAVGTALKELWLPVMSEGHSLRSRIEIAFSEVQWPADRIHYLESDSSARRERLARLFSMHLRGSRVDRSGPDHHSTDRSNTARTRPGSLLALEDVAPQRARDPLVEMQLPSVRSFLQDLDGTYGQTCYDMAREEQARLQEEGESLDRAWLESQATQTELGLTAELRRAALEDLLSEDTDEPSNGELWDALEAGEDTLADARDRLIPGLTLDDPVYPLRRALNQANAGRDYQQMVLSCVRQRPHHDSAELVQQAILPIRMGGEHNPLHRYTQELDLSLSGKLYTALGGAHRGLATNATKTAQKRLLERVQDKGLQINLSDHFSLTGTDAVSGPVLMAEIFGALLHDAEQTDKPWLADISPNGDIECEGQLTDPSDNPASEAARFIADLVSEDSDSPLHALLFPDNETVPVDDIYTPPDQDPQEIRGSGRFQPALWAQLSQIRDTPEPEQAATLEAASLWAQVQAGHANSAVVTRAILQGLDILRGHFINHIQKAEQRVSQLTREGQHLTMASHAPIARMLKAMSPQELGELRLITTNEAGHREHVVLGVYDPESDLRFGLTEDDRKAIHQDGQRRGSNRNQNLLQTPETETARMPTPEGRSERSFHVFAAPAGSQLARQHRQWRQALSRKRSLGERIDRLGLPYGVLGLEIWNLKSEWQRLDQTRRERSASRAATGAGSAFVNLGMATAVASEHLATRATGRRVALGTLEHVSFRSQGSLIQQLSPSAARHLPAEITRRMLLVTSLSLFEAGLKVMDARHSYRIGDRNTATALGVSAGGLLLSAWGGFSLMGLKGAQAGPMVLGLTNPVGWVVLSVGLTLAIGGTIAATLLRDDDMTQWLKNGPFGDFRDDSFRHLWGEPQTNPQQNQGPRAHLASQAKGTDPKPEDPEKEAFYRLLDLLAGIQVDASRADLAPNEIQALARESSNDPREQARIEQQLQKADTRLRITSNLMTLLTDTECHIHLQHREEEQRHRGRGEYVTRKTRTTHIRKDDPDSPPRRELDNGYELWVQAPYPGRQGRKRTVDHFRVMARLVSPLGTDQEWVFPAPEPSDPLVFDPQKHGAHDTPDFEADGAPFWSTYTTDYFKLIREAHQRQQEADNNGALSA